MSQAFSVLQQRAQHRWRELNEVTPWIRVGTDISGQAAGALEVVESTRAELARLGLQATVTEVGCLGLCYAEPLMDVKLPGAPRVIYNNVTVRQVPDIIQSHLVNGNPYTTNALMSLDGEVPGVSPLESVPMMRGQLRIAMRNCGHIDPTDVFQYIARGGFEGLAQALTDMTPADVLQQVKTSGLRGRGGAAFPTAVKWTFLTRSSGPVKYVLCNCEEGDPGAFNDKGLLEGDPFTVLEGMILAGYATGATNGIVFIRHGHHGPIERTEMAIQQCYLAGILGQNILDSTFSFDIEVSLTGESYVAGEETALMESIEGKRAMPRFRPPFPAQVGVWNKPSNINNVKTLAYVPEIVRRGGEWFKNIGTEKSTGTAILCLSGDIKYSGMMEVPFGLTLRHVIEEMAGGTSGNKQMKLLQTGGPLGGVLAADKLDTILDFDAMSKAGAILGSGGIIVGNEDVCAVDLTRNLVAFCQMESCGKCFPCRTGMSHLLEVIERICSFSGRSYDMDMMSTIGFNMQSGSLCGHGQLGFNPVKSAVQSFTDEFRAHIEEKRCPTGRCYGPFFGPQKTLRRSHFLGESATSQVYKQFVGVDIAQITAEGHPLPPSQRLG